MAEVDQLSRQHVSFYQEKQSQDARVTLQNSATAASTDLPVPTGLSHDCKNPGIEPIHPKTPSELFTALPTCELSAKSKPLIGQSLVPRGSPERNSPPIPTNKVLQLKVDLTDSLEPDLVKYPLHGGVLYKSLGGKKQRTSITQKNRNNSAIPGSFHRDRIKLRTGYLVTSYE
jgi:hypothetical protein